LTVTKKLRHFKEDAPGSPYYWKSTVAVCRQIRHSQREGTPGRKVSWVLL